MKNILISFFLLSIIVSCNKKLFVDKKYIIKKQKGIIVFIDNESRKYRNMGNGDVFTDSLIPDFFIPYNFSNKVITDEDIDKALFSKPAHKVSFFYLIRDCQGTNRSSSIEVDSKTLFLDKNIDDYLHSKKIYVQPTEIEFIRSDIDREYYDLHKDIIISYKNGPLKLIFDKGSLEILRMNVLEYEWKK